MSEAKGDIKHKWGDKSLSEWKHSQISDPEDIDALSDLLTIEIEKEFAEIEKKLEAYWQKRKL